MATYSTLAEAKAAYLQNADYAAGGGSTSTCERFVAACRALLVLLPEEAEAKDVRTRMSVRAVERQLQQAEAWLAGHAGAAGSGGAVRYASFEDFRS